MPEYTQTRITKEYLDKLRKLAAFNKRSMIKQLEVLVDNENHKIASKVIDQVILEKREKELEGMRNGGKL